MTRKYTRWQDKIDGIVPEIGMGATIWVDRYKVPCTVQWVGTTDRRMPMVAVQVDGRARDGSFVRDETGEVLAFTYRKTGQWRRYGDGYKTGARLELGVRRSKDRDEGTAQSEPEQELSPTQRMKKFLEAQK